MGSALLLETAQAPVFREAEPKMRCWHLTLICPVLQRKVRTLPFVWIRSLRLAPRPMGVAPNGLAGLTM